MSKLDTAGSFLCTVTEPTNGWIQTVGKNETPCIRIPLVVAEGEHEGQTISETAWLSDKAFEATIKNLVEVFGWNGDLDSLHKGQGFTGMQCRIVTEMEEYEGKMQYRVKWLNHVDGGGGAAIDPAKASAIIGALQRKSMALAASIAKPGSAAPKPVANDRPF